MPIGTIQYEFQRDDLLEAGRRAVTLIRERTLAGGGIDGPMQPYSTKPFARPLGGISKRALSTLKSEGKLHVFTTKQGKLWAIIEGGYAAYKAAAYPGDSSQVNMSATGATLRALTVVSASEQTGTVTIGFTRPEAAEIASYHNLTGAGKSRVIRRWFGLTEDEKIEVAKIAARGIRIKT